MQFASEDDQIRAALFRLVDVTPACRSVDDLATHLIAYLEQIPERPTSLGAAIKLGDTAPGRTALGKATAAAVRHMAHRFIVGESPRAALSGISLGAAGSPLRRPARRGDRDAGGGRRYAERCHEALETLAGAAATWPERPWLERDSVGLVPRVNLSVKVTALTPLMRPEAPHLGRDDAAERMRLRRARELGAHLHVDMESVDSLETTLELVLGVLAEPEFAAGRRPGSCRRPTCATPCAARSAARLGGGDRARAAPRGPAGQGRLLGPGGGRGPSARLAPAGVRAQGRLRSQLRAAHPPPARRAPAGPGQGRLHNLRSVAHAIAYNRLQGGDDADLELQVLRGLGDELAEALRAERLRVRSYCPVGDLVAGMAYLVRRLLENTSNDSFLRAHAHGAPVEELLAAP